MLPAPVPCPPAWLPAAKAAGAPIRVPAAITRGKRTRMLIPSTPCRELWEAEIGKEMTGIVCAVTLPCSVRTLIHHLSSSRTLHRSEEHTSELQSLMRISYAVFCLKKKNRGYNKMQP